DEGDEILIPGPVYSGYIPLIKTLGGVPVYIDTTETNYKVTPEAIEAHLTAKTKDILLNYPTNPTGVILNHNEVQALTETLKHMPI
ncbi:aminotransferase class I/II-fold pyridoxal phosphate-dependent enzyme, partial [Staphylococcus hominis]|uniref:aminotransferase class I/II-fold pyridoxal phosphate-dependent enzyme n=1 Tax=Staphylococcus hominis TaxID=1290 RepID=UPI0030BF2FBD